MNVKIISKHDGRWLFEEDQYDLEIFVNTKHGEVRIFEDNNGWLLARDDNGGEEFTVVVSRAHYNELCKAAGWVKNGQLTLDAISAVEPLWCEACEAVTNHSAGRCEVCK